MDIKSSNTHISSDIIMRKNIILVIIILLAIFIVNRNIANNHINPNSFIEENKDLSNNKSAALVIEKEKFTQIESHDFNQYSKIDMLKAYGICGGKIPDLQILKVVDQLTEIQLESLYVMENYCDSWNEYFISKGKDFQDELFKNNKQRNGLSSEFLLKNISTNEQINKARNLISNNEDPSLGYVFVNYLLRFDNEFIKAIGNLTKTQNTTYIRIQDEYLSILYQCQLQLDNCSATSYQMFSLCMINENNCGLSYRAYLQTQININQFSDLENAYYAMLSVISNMDKIQEIN